MCRSTTTINTNSRWFFARQFGDDLGDGLLQGMIRLQVRIQWPIIQHTCGQHSGVLAAAIHL